MGSIRSRSGGKYLFFDFYYLGVRCREQTKLRDTKENRRNMTAVLEQIEAEIVLKTFVYAKYFPNSPMVKVFNDMVNSVGNSALPKEGCPLLVDFAREWFSENEVRWKRSYREMVAITLKKHLIPEFGEKGVDCITKSDVLKFRSTLAKVQDGKKLSPDRVNHILTPLRMMLEDAADRFHFNTPFVGIKQLTVQPTQVDPFSLEEVQQFLDGVRSDFRTYYLVRFLTGMRTAEIDGLKWKYVDFERREILIRETLVNGHEETTKTSASARCIAMSMPVYEALKVQFEAMGQQGGYVFSSRGGTPLDYTNVANRVWYPTLKKLGLKQRRPYQTRHTAATLWLASGESPEWIARQMGHTTTKMLFTVYSRFVPNLTRRDGSAFENLLAARLNGGSHE